MMILPSKIESFGTIALEAMARRGLVLVSGECGIVNWPDLRDGVYVIRNNETLSGAIRRISEIDYSERLRKAESAYSAARAFNDDTIGQWTNLFSAFSNRPRAFRTNAGQR